MSEVSRPRIEGVALELVTEIGYDQLTLDAVSARARVSKASIYRRWGDKSALVDAAIDGAADDTLALPDTGSVVGDLAALCATPGFFDIDKAGVVCGLATALHRDPDRHDGVRERLVHDGTKHVHAILGRAVERGELGADTDVELLSSVVPAMVLFRMTYQTPGTFGATFVADVVETILTPAVQRKG